MRTKKPALILYVTACILAMLAAIIDNDALLLISRPIIIPAIYFYYLSTRIRKADPWVFVFLLLTFIGDTIILLEFKDALLFIMIPYFLSYLLLIRYTIADIRKVGFSKFGAVIGILVLGGLTFLMVLLTQFFSYEQRGLILPVMIYGIVLSIYGALAGYYFYVSSSKSAFYMMMTSLASIVSDVFYALFTLLFLFPVFSYVNSAIQLLSYYFVIRYFILRKH